MTDQARLFERAQVIGNYMDDHAGNWPEWKVRLVMSKLECLLKVMETTERREAGRL